MYFQCSVLYGGVRKVAKNFRTSGKYTSICEADYLGSPGSMDTSGLLASDQSRTTKFATVNFLKVAIAKATNLLFSKLLMVIMRL